MASWMSTNAASQAHEEENGTQNDRRRSTQGDGTSARWWQAMTAGRLNLGSSVVAPPATDHCDRLRSIANQVSSCLHCPGPGDENVGPLSLATTDLLTVATEHADHPGVATIPAMEPKARGLLPWRTTICPRPRTAVVTLWGPVVLPTTPCRRLVAPIACSSIHLVLEPNRTAS